LFHKPLELIVEADICGLIQNQEQEGRMLDYKETLPAPTDNNEFRYDVTSLANASGGELIYGVRERQQNGRNTGEPGEIAPIMDSLDAEILRLEQILQTNISPRLRGVRFRAIPLQSGGNVLLIRVPKAWAGLHLAN
jgi:predicted HTH transcriptional regulator